jgi:hypothetical protein
MVTKKELEAVLDQVNAILKRMDERLVALEEVKKNTQRSVKKT